MHFATVIFLFCSAATALACTSLLSSASSLASSSSSAFSSLSSSSSSSSNSSLPLVTAWRKCNGTTIGTVADRHWVRHWIGIVNNIQYVKYSSKYVYTYTSGIPDHTIGPWVGLTDNATDQKKLLKFPITPTPATTTKTEVGRGAIAQMINGAGAYNSLDAVSYNNQGVWNRNANYYEASTFDSCNGHPTPAPAGQYHYHLYPKCIYSNANNTSHSQIFGYSFDGYPIYGPYGYSSANSSNSSITRMKTSYRFRSITVRQTLANGITLTTAQYGPPVNSTYPIGLYAEDFEYISGLGDLDENNGRWCVTPDYPNGTYAYFITIDSSGAGEYPYILGKYYYGVVESTSVSMMGGGGVQSISESVTTYFTCSSNQVVATFATIGFNIISLALFMIIY